jgi:hypothetical protein
MENTLRAELLITFQTPKDCEKHLELFKNDNYEVVNRWEKILTFRLTGIRTEILNKAKKIMSSVSNHKIAELEVKEIINASLI